MSIFTNYDNLSPGYVPNNMTEIEPFVEPVDNKPPRLVLNAKKEFLGYCWYHGEIFDFIVKTDYTEEEIKDKKLVLTINNFRGEEILETSSENSTSVTLRINEEVNNLMLAGSYNAILKCVSENVVEFEQLFSIAVL